MKPIVCGAVLYNSYITAIEGAVFKGLMQSSIHSSVLTIELFRVYITTDLRINQDQL